MEILRNLPIEIPMALASLITPKKNQIVSMTLSQSKQLQIILFTFADKETVSEEAYLGDTMYLVIEGETYITKEDIRYHLKEGDTLMIPAHTLHAIGGKGAFKLLQITVNE
ncbi:cupin domain-containing protein [Petroclostridium sp. X23]|jgi:quercetin dioxygenase-like cupin family protein|uniref:cupin domain-containing protein n=1 Tax=Petroclostridium sp. X23 TaxID=3045146 RepID=UPI0024AD1701|nr:cupin domain-containing protein [Petroclostridium sp. X23]WHH58689.1 cupin domain-containing protein [Petroclostridium sp. X23]